MSDEDHPRWVKATDSPGVLGRCNACGDEVQTLYRPWGVFELDQMYCAECTVAQTNAKPPVEYGEWTRGNAGQVGRTVTTWHPSLMAPGEWIPTVAWEPHPDEIASA